MIWFSSFF